jgi:hypothetical protein
MLLLISCNPNDTNRKGAFKEIQIVNLKMSIPRSYIFRESNGVDSYVAKIISPDKDTFFVEYGDHNIISNLYESPMGVISNNDSAFFAKKYGGKIPDRLIISKYPSEDMEKNIFQRNYYFYDTVNNILVQIVQPKKIGNGITGIYIPSLKDGKSFSIAGYNLDSTKNAKALRMFRTITYIK